MSGTTAVDKVGCVVCDTIPQGDLIELDLIMGDATKWPPNVWGRFDRPAAPLPPSFRRFGAIESGMRLLQSRGHLLITRQHVRKHYNLGHVPITAAEPDDLVAAGVAASSDNRQVTLPGAPIDPLAYIRYYQKGIALGNRGLELMHERIEAMVAAGEVIPLAVLKMVVDLGAKLATSQAAIKAKGVELGGDSDPEEGFRAGSAPLPSARMGHARVRIVEGVSRPVTDQGPADRAHYSERARQEGSPELPHR
jgi:hypothetical protein